MLKAFENHMSWPDFAILVMIVMLSLLSLLNSWKAKQVWLWQFLLLLLGWSVCWFSVREEGVKVKLVLTTWICMLVSFALGWSGRMPGKLQ
jgi:hypothetical protein